MVLFVSPTQTSSKIEDYSSASIKIIYSVEDVVKGCTTAMVHDYHETIENENLRQGKVDIRESCLLYRVLVH